MTEDKQDVPENAPEHCPGTSSEQAGKSSACAGCPNQQICATAPKGPDPDIAAIEERMRMIKHKILVLSGKGGVGKSTFAAQLAFALASQGKEVGLLDIDICGPSMPKMLGLEGHEVHQSASGWSPVYVEDNLGVMSIGFMLPNPDDAVIWRGPRKNGLIKQFLKDVEWGPLDYLVVDAPPGTSDEHITIAQCLKTGPADGAIIVTTPQEVSIIDVRKEINFCKKVSLPVLGVVENMSGLVQPVQRFRFVLQRPVCQPGATEAEPEATSTGTSSTRTSQMAVQGEDVTDKVLSALQQLFPDLGALNYLPPQYALPAAAAAAAEAAAATGTNSTSTSQPQPMSLMACTDVFLPSGGGAAHMCAAMGVRLLGHVPLDPALGLAAEQGRSVQTTGSSSVAGPALLTLVHKIAEQLQQAAEGMA